MEPKDKSENAKAPQWKTPVELSGVNPEAYKANIDSANGSAAPDMQSGAAGFSPQLAGNGKAGRSGTSSFDAGPPDYTLPGHPSGGKDAVREEKKHPVTSSVGQVAKK